MTSFSIESQGFLIRTDLHFIGSDIVILLSGGDSPHVGTVTTWSFHDNKMISQQFPSHSGRLHKDHLLAEIIVDGLKDFIACNVVICSGVHVNGISQKQINASKEMAGKLSVQIKEWLEKHPVNREAPIYKIKN